MPVAHIDPTRSCPTMAETGNLEWHVAESTSSRSEAVEPDFEQALKRLNALVEKLESGQLPLEESVAAFEEGVKLTRHCETLLDSADQRLQVLACTIHESP